MKSLRLVGIVAVAIAFAGCQNAAVPPDAPSLRDAKNLGSRIFEISTKNKDKKVILGTLEKAFYLFFGAGKDSEHWEPVKIIARKDNGLILRVENKLRIDIFSWIIDTNIFLLDDPQSAESGTKVTLYFAVDQEGDRVAPKDVYGGELENDEGPFFATFYRHIDRFIPQIRNALNNSSGGTFASSQSRSSRTFRMGQSISAPTFFFTITPERTAVRDEAEQKFLDKEYEAVLDIIRPLAANGEAPYQRALGMFYLRGYGLDKNANEYKKWMMLAAGNGDPIAQAVSSVSGWSGRVDVSRGISILRDAARVGNIDAIAAIADGLRDGWPAGERDFAQAHKLMSAASELGHVWAAAQLKELDALVSDSDREASKAYAAAWLRMVPEYKRAAPDEPVAKPPEKEEKKAAQPNPSPKPAAAKSAPTKKPVSDAEEGSLDARLEKLNSLLKRGLISEEDAARKRKEILEKL
jgi:hypothetical protein